jgi:hypothetical protein
MPRSSKQLRRLDIGVEALQFDHVLGRRCAARLIPFRWRQAVEADCASQSPLQFYNCRMIEFSSTSLRLRLKQLTFSRGAVNVSPPHHRHR